MQGKDTPQEDKPFDEYTSFEEAWNVKGKFAYDMLAEFEKAWDLLEIAERKQTKGIPNAARQIKNKIFRPLRIYLEESEAKIIESALNSRETHNAVSNALDDLWAVFSIDLGHIIPKKKDRTLNITDRYKNIRTRRREKDKKRASASD